MKSTFTGKIAVRKYFHFCFRALLPAFFFLGGLNNAFSQNSVDVLIDPASTNVEVGETFTVDVKVDFGTGSIASINAYVFFNTLDLEVVSLPTVPTATSNNLLPGVSISFNSLENMNSTGQIRHGRFNSDPMEDGTHPNDDFVFFTITFRALRVPPGGTTPLTFGTTFPTETAAGEFNQADALNQTINGTVVISAVGCTTPLATISAPCGTTTCNGQGFNLILASATGESPFDVTIDGPEGIATYDNITVGSPITTFAPPVVNIWNNPTPVTFDDGSHTLGTRFTSSVSGFIKGLRFFGADDVSATPSDYTGQLWTNTGTLVASGTFTSVSAGSWNELHFATPILINPGAIYIVSYNTGTSQYYASTSEGLGADFVNGPLTAFGNGGLYIQGPSPTFPIFSGGHNYWVDVLFSPNEYSFELTGITDANGCVNTGSLQTLPITSVDCETLPVSLLGLSATPKDNTIVLTWSTASEINNKGFEVQRKTETGDWVAIGFVKGAGSSQSMHYYDYTDGNLQANRYYYRLKQVDIDGRFEYSPVVSAVVGSAEKFSLEQNYPNPFRTETVIRFTLPGKTNVKLSLYDMQGRLVRNLFNGSKDKGTHAVSVNSSTLTSGIYYYKLESENFSAVKKMTVQ